MTEKEASQKILATLRSENYPDNYLPELVEFLEISQFSNTSLSNEKIQSLEKILNELKQQCPVEYIVGHAHFYGYQFIVNQHVLIPRVDTEELVSGTLNIIKELPQKLTLIDIGTGSGAIILSLAKKLLETSRKDTTTYIATDISTGTLEIAKKNAQLLAIDSVTFQLADVSPQDCQGNFLLPDDEDVVIVTNPPYIDKKAKATLPSSVVEYEPHLALFEQEGFLKKLTDYLHFLRSNGKRVHLAIEYSKDEKMIQRFAKDLRTSPVEIL